MRNEMDNVQLTGHITTGILYNDYVPIIFSLVERSRFCRRQDTEITRSDLGIISRLNMIFKTKWYVDIEAGTRSILLSDGKQQKTLSRLTIKDLF